MKKLLFLLLPWALWADYLFVFYDAGETVALAPVVEELKARGEEVRVAKLERGDRYAPIEVKEKAPDILVVGDASMAQLQYVRAFKGKACTVCYYDNPLEIDRIPYASLIREFEKEVDFFLVPSKKASSMKGIIVGNPDLDRFEKEVGAFQEVPGRIVYFGGYDDDYEEAFAFFIQRYRDAIVYPHPSTDGSLERKYGAHIGEDPSIQAVGEAELVAVHRSSIGVKAAIAGKKVIAIESNGDEKELKVTRESLGLPQDALVLISDFLLQKRPE